MSLLSTRDLEAEAKKLCRAEAEARLRNLADHAATLADGDPLKQKLLDRYVADFQMQADRYLEQFWSEVRDGK